MRQKIFQRKNIFVICVKKRTPNLGKVTNIANAFDLQNIIWYNNL